ncbi:error-prone DNA polymerase [Mesorhizobium sp. RP14(2022)]|uniref:Error-prone DNA polymerase n=1 Tax=Mesorhizobium liriopis TaxID=2953882 RepID=A0ABT1C813_9HYPH|nr:error-prone DNA polymerase [Mesorhizobium liriopis]MCO6050988.1 error-prone DNA polymerase [Mesorhizobium liriopis]
MTENVIALPVSEARERKAETEIAYAEFGMRSSFSFLEGASKPEEMMQASGELGFHAVGLADRNTVAGVVRAWGQIKVLHAKADKERREGATDVGTPPFYHPGVRLVFADGTPDILAYPRDRTGWGHLCRMLTEANFAGEKGAPRLLREGLLRWGRNLSLIVLPDLDKAEVALPLLREFCSAFGRAVRVGTAPLYCGEDQFRFAQASVLAQAAGLPMMAVGDALYHMPFRRPLQDVVTAIRHKTTVARAGFALEGNAERFLKPPSEMKRLFYRYPEAIAETIRFTSELGFCLSELHHNYPDEPTRDGATAQEELERLTWEGAAKRWPREIPPKHRKTILHEFALVREKEYARYFLTVHDIMRFARDEAGILCQGRGSAANSVICYCLGITDVNPDLGTCLFERFISRERDEPPDIDVDFEHEHREKVIQYIYRKYREKHTALACAVISYRPRSALREVGKALGFTDDALSALSGVTWRWKGTALDETEANGAGLKMGDPETTRLFALANSIIEHPRHLSQHVGGFVITKDRLDEIVPIVKTAMEDRKMVEWDKDDLDAVQLLKVDILALGMLSCLQRCFGLLKAHYGMDLTLAAITERQTEEPAVYAMIQRADTLGVFQIESRAQMSMLPRLKPKQFYDLVIEVAIVRPGPIQGEMVHPYLRRREGKEPVEYHQPQLEAILGRTYGVPLFQEQAMRIAIECAKFTPGEADELRRSMATFRRTGTIKYHEERMIAGMVKNGYPEEFAKRCFAQIRGFGEYGFPESHAASFALLVYASCWFKAWYPDVFCAAILNSQPMGFYAPAQLVRDAREHGVEVRVVDVNHSLWDCTLEDDAGAYRFDPTQIAKRHAEMRDTIRSRYAVRLGFRLVKGLREEDMTALAAARGEGYDSVRDVWLRTRLSASVIRRLAEADAFRSLGLDRREALWAAQALDPGSATERLPLFDSTKTGFREHEPETRLPPMPLGAHVVHDYRAMALSLKAHPVLFLRSRLVQARVMPSARLADTPSNRRVSVAGLVLVRQRPGSAKGVIFMTLEDETGVANIIVWKKCFELHRAVVLGARFVRVEGRLQSQSGVIHVVAERITDLSSWLGLLAEEGPTIKTLTRADEIGHQKGSMDMNHVEPVRRVMPKGRNFH